MEPPRSFFRCFLAARQSYECELQTARLATAARAVAAVMGDVTQRNLAMGSSARCRVKRYAYRICCWEEKSLQPSAIKTRRSTDESFFFGGFVGEGSKSKIEQKNNTQLSINLPCQG